MRFWTSDHHFGHDNILRYCDRPYGDVGHMREALVAKWNEVVTPDDEVWVLGDFALGNVQHTVHVAERLNGRLVLVPGNHDKCWAGRSNGTKFEDMYLRAGFYRIEHRPTGIEIAGIPVNVSHFPYAGESQPDRPDRFSKFRLPDHGEWLIHGHVHNAWRVSGRQINIGVDVWGGYPVADSVLADILTEGTQYGASVTRVVS